MSSKVTTTKPKKKKAPVKKQVETRGRKTELSDETIENIMKNIRKGIPIKTAVQMAGISQSTYFSWMKRGNDEQYRISKGEKPNPKETLFLEFLESATRAREEARGAHVAVIANAGAKGDWRASAWWLSRQYRDEFGDNPTSQVQNITNNTLNISTSMAELQTLIAEIKERRIKVIDAPSD